VAEYLIGCVNTQNPHSHIISAEVQKQVGTGYEPTRTLTVTTIISKLADGDRFETYSPSTDKVAAVQKDTCSEDGCNVETIRSAADAVTDNNLNNMPCP
jgi:Protein of unknown function (DUF3892)